MREFEITELDDYGLMPGLYGEFVLGNSIAATVDEKGLYELRFGLSGQYAVRKIDGVPTLLLDASNDPKKIEVCGYVGAAVALWGHVSEQYQEEIEELTTEIEAEIEAECDGESYESQVRRDYTAGIAPGGKL